MKGDGFLIRGMLMFSDLMLVVWLRFGFLSVGVWLVLDWKVL